MVILFLHNCRLDESLFHHKRQGENELIGDNKSLKKKKNQFIYSNKNASNKLKQENTYIKIT